VYTSRSARGAKAAACFVFAAALLPAAICGADAQPLTLAEAERLALRAQPTLAAFERAADASREAAIAERQLPDPRLRAGIVNLPVTTGDAFHFDRDDQTMVAIGIAQEMVRQDKREASALRQEAMADASLAERDAEMRRIRRDVALAWLDAAAATQRRELLERMTAELVTERDVVKARLAAAGAEVREVFVIDAALAATGDQRESARRDERRARAMLARWIGTDAERPLATLPAEADGASDELAQRLRIPATRDVHPQVAEARALELATRQDVKRAALETERDWSWEVSYGKRFAGRSDMLTVQVDVPLSWDAPNRQNRRTAEKRALADRAQLLLVDRERQLEAERQAALIDWETAVARDDVQTRQLLPATDARLETSLAAFRTGRVPYVVVAEARRAAIDARLQQLTARTDLAKAAVALRYFE